MQGLLQGFAMQGFFHMYSLVILSDSIYEKVFNDICASLNIFDLNHFNSNKIISKSVRIKCNNLLFQVNLSSVQR